MHIPRTAGTSIIHWLEKNNIEHERDATHPSITMIQDTYDISFACVRNPWERMVSMYAHFRRPGFLWEMFNIKHESELPTWDEFLTNPTQKLYWFDVFTNQVEWIPNGVDILLRHESLADDFAQVQKLLNCNQPLPHSNGSVHDDYRSYYNTWQEKRISEIFSKDIDTFKYSF